MSHDHPKVLVTGANGGLGSAIVYELLKLGNADDIAISVRDPDAAERLIARGVRVRRGDFDDPDSLDIAFEGAENVVIISTRSFGNQQRFVQQRNAIDAARRAGARHIGYTSIIQRPGSVFEPAPGHHLTEDYLLQCGVAATVFCNGNYIENLPMFFGSGLSTGVLALPADGPTAWVARQNLAEAIARTMLEGRHKGESLALTGPEALDFTQIAKIAGEIIGRAIERRIVSTEAFINALVSRGMPAGAASTLATGFESRAQGELAAVDPVLEQILGRPRQSVHEVLPSLISVPATA